MSLVAGSIAASVSSHALRLYTAVTVLTVTALDVLEGKFRIGFR